MRRGCRSGDIVTANPYFNWGTCLFLQAGTGELLCG